MNSGTPREIFEMNFELSDYDTAHAKDGCKGKFDLKIVENAAHNLNALGIIMLPVMPVVACPTCQSAYMVPGFEHFVELKIAYKLVVSPNILSPKEIRFLRLCFDITQQDVANFIQCERSYYAKCESQKSDTHRLSMDKQKILKFFYAEKLAIGEFKKIYDAIKDLRDESILPLLSVDELELRRAHA